MDTEKKLTIQLHFLATIANVILRTYSRFLCHEGTGNTPFNRSYFYLDLLQVVANIIAVSLYFYHYL